MTVAPDVESAEVPAERRGVRRSSAIGVLAAGVLGLAAAATLTVENEATVHPSLSASFLDAARSRLAQASS